MKHDQFPIIDLKESVTQENLHELLDSFRQPEKGHKVNFNIMVCGPSGSGKSSFIDLFIRKFNFKVAEQLIKKAENI